MIDPVAAFLRSYGAAAVGATPPQPLIPPTEDGEDADAIDRTIECVETEWAPRTVSEQPADRGE